MTASQIFRALWRRMWLIVLITIVAVGAVAVVDLRATRMYSAVADVYFSTTFGRSATDLSQGTTYTQSHVATYAQLASSPLVLDRVVDELDLSMTGAQLAQQVTATSSRDTVIVRITVTDRNAAQAADIANSVAHNLGVVTRDLSPRDANNAPVLLATITSPATQPASPSSPQTRRDLLAAALGGIALGCLVVVLWALIAAAVAESRSKDREGESAAGATHEVAVDGPKPARSLTDADEHGARRVDVSAATQGVDEPAADATARP